MSAPRDHDDQPDDHDDIPSVTEIDDQPMGVDPDDDRPKRGPAAMPGIPTEGEPPDAG